VICPSCGTPNEAGRKFCGECGTRLAAICASCGTANSPGTRFCGECGTALEGAASPGPAVSASASPGRDGAPGPFEAMTRAVGGSAAGSAATPVSERRLVTVLFADLVGFTTISEGRDPEEVRELLSRYFEVAREVIERYAGTVENFIGAAVMGVWGAPTAHEDDAERGVRAALEVIDAVKDLGPGLQARAGVLTGEAAVTVGARGQGMVAGDLVNTASRLQSVAGPGMVLVGETTQQSTSGSIAYEPAGEQLLKGKTAPVTAYHALRVVARRGGAGRGDKLEPPFVGRDSELRLLKDLFHTTSREKRVRLVSVTGQGGIGKSRLAWELRKYADGVAQDLFWHEGRSPAYGQGITFWALGEMVRARAQLLETDDPETTRGKIVTSVARWFPEGDEHDRVVRALGALLGVADAPAGGGDELFGAWRLYFERMAEQYLVTMVFEDLHWADPGTLDFIDHVLEWCRNVPILIVTLARPELLEHRPDWGAGRRNFLALDLEPLGEESMRELLKGIVPNLSEPAVRSIVARAEGIPLYAVETIRMLAADGRLRELPDGGFEPVGDVGELAVPNSLHALIAARLDALEPADRTLVQDAAVLGQSFTPAGLSAVSGIGEAALLTRLRELVKADLLTEERDDRSPERGQFAFVQALIREVAYSTLSLKDRRSRHLAAARFFESLGDDELAGALAAHYVAAFKATTDPAEAAPLGTQARLALKGAADRADALGSPRQALAFLDQAIEITTNEPELADLLERAIAPATVSADYNRALELAPQLRRLRQAMGDQTGEAMAAALEIEALWVSRQREHATKLLEQDLPRFENLGDHSATVRLLLVAAQSENAGRNYERGTQYADRGLAIAERIGDAELATRLLMIKGSIAQYQGRLWEAIALAQGARLLAEQHGLAASVHRANGNLSNALALDDPRSTVDLEKETLAYNRRNGRRENEAITLGNLAEDIRRTGEWDWVLRELDGTINRDGAILTDLILEMSRALLLTYRGQIPDDEVEALLERVQAADDDDVKNSAYDLKAARAAVRGDFGGASAAWETQAAESPLNAPYSLAKAGAAAVLAGDAAGARRVLEGLEAIGTRGRAVEADAILIRSGIAGLEGDPAASLAGLRSALVRYRDLGLPWDEALVGVTAAVAVGTDEPEVTGWLEESRAIYERLKAKPLLDLVDRLRARVRDHGDRQSLEAGRTGARHEAETSA
jgi:class 3 adenylate cyclase/predicted ATPase